MAWKQATRAPLCVCTATRTFWPILARTALADYDAHASCSSCRGRASLLAHLLKRLSLRCRASLTYLSQLDSMATSEDLLAIGKQCSHQSCHLVDFLPFKCQHCQESYCQEHFMVQTHSCPKYDESKHNRVAPNCKVFN